jgi:hypothetical protein
MFEYSFSCVGADKDQQKELLKIYEEETKTSKRDFKKNCEVLGFESILKDKYSQVYKFKGGYLLRFSAVDHVFK